MTLFRQSPASPATRYQETLDAQTLLSENYPPFAGAASIAPATQSVFGAILGLRKDDLVTGVMLRLSVAAAGTSPTLARFGLASSAGVMLARSGDLKTAAEWAAGPTKFALSTPYRVLADGAYYACFVVDGVWGTTQPTALRVAGNGTAMGSGGGVSFPLAFLWGGQTDLPAVGGSLTLTANGHNVYMAVY